jgi:hypothetical protein
MCPPSVTVYVLQSEDTAMPAKRPKLDSPAGTKRPSPAGDDTKEPTADFVLPPGLPVGKILQWLAIRDLKRAVLVSRLWRQEGEAPGLWAPLVRHLVIGPANIDSAVEVLGGRRFRLLRELTVTYQDCPLPYPLCL